MQSDGIASEAPLLSFLLNAAWQLPLLVAIGCAAERLLRRAPAQHRHLLWLAIAVSCLLLPVASVLRLHVESSGGTPAPMTNDAASAPFAASGQRQWVPARFSSTPVSPPLAAWVIATWVAASGLRATLLFVGWRRARRLVRRASRLETSPALPPLLHHRTRPRERNTVPVLASPLLSGPVTVGVLRPVILVPSGFFERVSTAEAIAARAHEMAHVRRRDYLKHLVSEVLLLPVAFHPAVYVLRRRLALARETACDEAAVATAIGRRDYARSLLALAAAAAGLPRPTHVMGVLDARTLEVRMKQVLDERPRLGNGGARAVLLVAVAALAVFGAAAATHSVTAVTAGSGDLTPFLGTWDATWPGKDDPFPLPALALQIRPQAIDEFWWKYERVDGSGARAETSAQRVTGYRVEGRTLFLTVRVDDFRVRKDDAPAPAVLEHAFELRDDDTALFREVSNSYFAARQQREAVPPPPPPLVMRRTAAAR